MSSTRSCCLLLTLVWGKLLLEHTVTFCVWRGSDSAVVVLQSDVGVILCPLSFPLPLWCSAKVLGKPHEFWPAVLGQVGAWLPAASMEIGCCLSFPTWHPLSFTAWGNWWLAQVLHRGRKTTKFQPALKSGSLLLTTFEEKDFFKEEYILT